MHRFPVFAVLTLLPLLCPSAHAGLTLPSYWEGDGLARWTTSTTLPTNHGGSTEVGEECFGTLRVQSYGPVLRGGATIGAADATLTYGDGGRYVYPTRIELIPDFGACTRLAFEIDATHSGLDLFDETFDCGELGCSTLTLSWSDDGVGSLAMRVPRADGGAMDVDATIGTTFRLG